MCLPTPAAPFQTGVCVYKAGDNECPTLFPTKHVYYDKFEDTRGCSDCSCGNPLGGACTATIDIYKDPTVNTCNTLLTTMMTARAST